MLQRLDVRLVLAAVSGALVVGARAFDALETVMGLGMIASFIAWHCIVCAALHFGTQRVGVLGNA